MSTTYADITITSKDEVTVTLTRYATDAERVTGGVESYELHGPVSVDADAIYTNADGSIELVTLDATDCVDQVLATLTEDEMLAIHAGETKYRTIGHDVEVGDGDTFQRLALR